MLSESDWEKVNQEGDLSLSNSILTRSKSRQMQDFAVNKVYLHLYSSKIFDLT